MKNYFITILSLLILTAASLSAADNLNKKITNEQIEENLLIGLQSNNVGLRVSCAYMLGEIQPSEKAILLLMKTLRDDKDERARIMSALTLTKLEDPRGLNIVQRECQYNNNCKTRKMCQRFYSSYLNKKYNVMKETRDSLYAVLLP